jgi:HK97 family phage major capsid protein
MSDYTMELKGYVDEIRGLSQELKGVPEQYRELKAKAEETEQKMAELAQSFDIATKRMEIAGGNVSDLASMPEVKSLMAYIKKGVAQELNGPSGGYLVTPTLAQRIVELQTDLDVFRQFANVISIGTNLAQVPVETSKPTTSWVGEIETRPETDNVGVGLGNIPVNTVQATVKISRDLLADAAVVNFESYVLKQLSWALASAEGAAFVVGDSFKKPEGLFASASITQGSTTASGSAVTADEVIGLWEATTQATDNNAAYYMNKKTAVALRKLKASGSGEYLWQREIAQGVGPTFNGFPVRILKSAPDIGAGRKPIAFGDLQNTYTIVDRMDMDILRDELTGASTNTVKYIVNKRVGGGVVQPKSMAILTCHA